MISDQMRHELWAELLDSRRVLYYYEALGNRRARMQTAIRTAVLFSITGAFTLLVATVPNWVGLCLAGLAALLTLVESQLNWGAQAAIAKAIQTACGELLREWESLWRSAHRPEVTDETVASRMQRLQRLDILVTSRAGALGVNHSDRLNQKVTKLVKEGTA